MCASSNLYLIVCTLLCFKCLVIHSQIINETNNEATLRSVDNESFTTDSIDCEEDVSHCNNRSEVRIVFPPDLNVISAAVENLQDNKCRRDSYEVVRGIMGREQWAMQMLDASPKFPVGVLYGSAYQLGNFDECVEVEYNAQEDVGELVDAKIRGQYCLANIHGIGRNENSVASRATFNNTLHWAICVPSSCAVDDIATFLRDLFRIIHIEDKISITLPESNCYFEHYKPLSRAELIYGSAILLFLLFTSAATIYHAIQLYKKGKCCIYSIDGATKSHPGVIHQILLSFSVAGNVRKILKVRHNKSNLECISGLKFLCMLLIIPGHSLLFMTSGPVMNTGFYDKAITKVENALFLNNPLLVDTFLFLSGFLMCRLLILELDKRSGKVNFFVLYICRYVRLTPSYLVVIGLYCTFLTRMDNGPLWNSVIYREQERCLKSWWSNILYINNYINTDYLCMFQSWYLAADTQLFFIAPLIIYPLWRFRRCGKAILGIVTLATIITPGIETYVKRLDPTFMIYPSEVIDLSNNFYFKNVYIKTHIRASSYCIGLVFGYLIYKLQSSSVKIPSYVHWFGWLTASLCAIASMFSVTIFYQPGYEYSLAEATNYAIFHRVAWCLGFGWIVTACTTGNGGIVNKFLSWNFFTPLSRLTYCAYLVNGLIELHALGTLRQPRFMSIYNLGSSVTSHLVLTFVAAFILSVLFESPIHNLEKIIFERSRRQEKSCSSLSNTRTV